MNAETAAAPARRARVHPRALLLPLFRLGVLAFISFCLREQHRRASAQGFAPVTATEVRAFLPAAATLRLESGERARHEVLDANGGLVGHAARTSPRADGIRGYSGPADTLLVFGADGKLVGLSIRHSYDTPSHVEDVRRDQFYLSSWNGRTWEELAALNPANGGVEGLSGATRTSLCVARGLVARTRAEAEPAPTPWRFGRADACLLFALAGGLWFSFARHRPATARLRRGFQIAVVLGVGLVGGDLLAQSLLVGWVNHGIDWRATPGLALLAIAALLVPWAGRKPMYCAHVCPHGAVQEWLAKAVPARFKFQPGPALTWGLSLIAPALLLLVVLTSMLGLGLDLAGVEPFDAYAFQAMGVATLVVAVAGLFTALFIPMAYCRFACPTGALLKFMRSHGASDRFSSRDAFALCLATLAGLLLRHADSAARWITEAPWW